MYIVWAEYILMAGIGNQKGELGASFISNAMANRQKGPAKYTHAHAAVYKW